jgi:protein O-mannosyl-transferase
MEKLFSKKLSLFIILCASFIIHSSYLFNGFTWLDHGDIEKGRAVIAIKQLPLAFTTRFGDTGFYRPVITIANSIDAALYKNNSTGYHVTNLLLHLIITALVPLFLRQFFLLTKKQLLVCALLFSIHPLTFLPIGQISYRPELLMTIFVLAAIIFHIYSRKTNNYLYVIATLASTLLAFFSKETSLFLIPSIIVLWEINHRTTMQQTKNQPMRKEHTYKSIAMLYFLEFFVFLVYVFMRMYAVPDIWRVGELHLPFIQRIFVQLYTIGKFLFLFPTPLLPSLSDAIPITNLANPYILFSLIFIPVLLFLLLSPRMPLQLRNALLLFLIMVFPVINIVPVPRLGSPHYAYSALIPFASIVLLCYETCVNRFKKIHYPMLIFGILWLITASSISFLGGFRFKNDATLFAPDVAKDEHFLEGYFYLGNYYAGQKDFNAAEHAYITALKKDNTFIAYSEPVSTLVNLSAVYYAQKKVFLAEAALAKAYKVAPNDKKAFILYNQAVLANEQKDYQKIVLLLSNNDLHDALHNLKRNNEAIIILKQSLPYWNKVQREKVEELIRIQSQ